MQNKGMANHLKHYRKRAGLTIERVAEQLGLSSAQVSRLERGLSDLSLERLSQFARLYGCSPRDLLPDSPLPAQGEKTLPLIDVPVVGQVQAGVWKEALEWPPEERFAVKVPANPRFGTAVPLFALLVGGPSMNELYPDGSVVICASLTHWGKDPESGDKVVVERRHDSSEEFEATVKELRRHADGSWWLWPRSTDPLFQEPWKLRGADSDNGGREDLRITAIVTSSLRFER
jgi:transcriptional regulator with XRE-family HTH domain